MTRLLRFALRAGYQVPVPVAQLLAGREPSVLLYHGVPTRTWTDGHYSFDGRAFERQIVHLKQHFDLIHPDDVQRPRPRWARKAVVLTMDDGLRNNAVVAAPILRRHRVPCVFFVSTRHVGTDRVLWFAYLRGLEAGFEGDVLGFRGTRYDMTPPRRAESMRRLRTQLLSLAPHPAAMYEAIENELPPLESCLSRDKIDDWFTGMSEEQIGELADDPLFVIGVHTVDHPSLTRCSQEEAHWQLADCKRHLERIVGRPLTMVSYPNSDYDESTIRTCRELGLSVGYAVEPRVGRFPEFEIPRAGVYQPHQEVAAFKAMWARRRISRG